MTSLTDPLYTDANKAREHMERIMWPFGPICPHCGAKDERVMKLQGKSTRPGVYKCRNCEKPFTVTVGTVMEDSKIPLNKWLLAFALVNGSKKGISAHQLHRSLGITYKSAWFMAHRIREAMASDDETPFGNEGGIVEVDETFIGREPGVPKGRSAHHKMKVLSLVDRETGRAKSVVINNLTADAIAPIIYTNVRREAQLMTDQAHVYSRIGREFRAHHRVDHSVGEYVNLSNPTIHTNTIEGFFGIFKRGMRGIYQHCAKKHLHRYLAEFDFRYTFRAANGFNDAERTAEAIKGARGKRLTYRQPSGLTA
ncbi:MAG TPA: IS1595 family transposase [Allosphingosinicella sp.]|nr:IS1595 family transposase [Allosphingosinicella sp.]